MVTPSIESGQRLSENHLLACLPLATRALWLPHPELVDLALGQVLYEAQGRLTHVFFPLTVPPVMHLMLRFTQALSVQMAQTAVCNRHHSLDQQLCRWLLLTLDRLPGIELVMTQELIANMLGVRREGVTEAALKLQQDQVIRYARGRITVLNRPELEKRTCECYAVVKREYDRLLPTTPAQ